MFVLFCNPNRLSIFTGSPCLRTICMPQIQTMPTCSPKPAWFVWIALTVQTIRWSPVWTRVELCMFTTRDVSPLVLKPFFLKLKIVKSVASDNIRVMFCCLVQYGVTPVSRISMEKPEAVQISVFWVIATRAGRVVVVLDSVWEVMANRAKVSDITVCYQSTFSSAKYEKSCVFVNLNPNVVTLFISETTLLFG